MSIKSFIQQRYVKYTKLSLNRKCVYIYILWSLFGLYLTSEILSGQSDPIGLLPIAFLFYYGLWLLGGLALVFGIGFYINVNKPLGVLFYVLAISLSYQVLDKYASRISYILFMEAIDYNLVSLDSLVDQWRVNELPLYKSRGIENGLNQGQEISSSNLVWILTHCLKDNNDCFLQLWAAFNSGTITSDQISNAYSHIKRTEIDPCKYANANSKNLINYPLTPLEVLYDLRNYCEDNNLNDLNKAISLKEYHLNESNKPN